MTIEKMTKELAKKLDYSKNQIGYMFIKDAFFQQKEEFKKIVRQKIEKYKCGKHKRLLKVIKEL